MNHSPPCCASCPELDRNLRACKLLARPTADNRKRLLTMPCDVSRVLRHRFRPFGDEIEKIARAVWEDVAAEIEPPSGAGIDARVWLTMWPVTALCTDTLAARVARPVASTVSLGSAGASDGRATRLITSLLSLLEIDPLAVLLLVEGLNCQLDPALWRTALSETDAAFCDRTALAFFRLLCFYKRVLNSSIIEPRSLACLEARFFRSGDPSETASLAAARAVLAEPDLTMGAFRELTAHAAQAALEQLLAESGNDMSVPPEALAPFRVALKLDPTSRPEMLPGYEDTLFALLRRELAITQTAANTQHPPLVALLALTSLVGAPLLEHLILCQECRALARAEVQARAAVTTMLAGPGADVPVHAPALGPYTPRTIRCRDVVWETFSAFAAAEGRSVDDLVEEALEQYRVLRMHAKKPDGRGGLRIQRPQDTSSQSVSARPAPPSATESNLRGQSTPSKAPKVEEPTKPNFVNPLEDITRPATRFPGSREPGPDE